MSGAGHVAGATRTAGPAAGPGPTVSARIALAAFGAAALLLIPLAWWIPGGAAWLLSLILAVRQPNARIRQSLVILLGCVLILALAPIDTDLSPRHFITLGLPFLAVVVGPYLYLRRVAPGEVPWRFFPRRFSLRDLLYTLVSVPLAWLVIQAYFFHWNPEVPSHWSLPAEYDPEAVKRLTLGINAVGIWDELFFINTVYAILRRGFPAWQANLAQACVYLAVLSDMAFTGHGVWLVYLFALTQGIMYEKSGVLLYVLIVHLVVDLFLVLAILQYYYPDQAVRLFL